MKKYVPIYNQLFNKYVVLEEDVFDTEEEAKEEAQNRNYKLYHPTDVF